MYMLYVNFFYKWHFNNRCRAVRKIHGMSNMTLAAPGMMNVCVRLEAVLTVSSQGPEQSEK